MKNNFPVYPFILEQQVASFPIHCDCCTSCRLWLINKGLWEDLINSEEGGKLISLLREQKWSFLEGQWIKSLLIPTPVCAALTVVTWQRTATSTKFTFEWMSSARWQDWGQRGQTLSDWKQVELTRILEERLMLLIVQQSGTFWHNQKKWNQKIGMLEHWRLELKLSNMSLPWQDFQGFQIYTPCWGETWWGLILFLTTALWKSCSSLTLLGSNNTYYMICFYAFWVEANVF